MKGKVRDKKIKIHRGVDVAEPGARPKIMYQPIHEGSLWAYVRHTSGTEVFYASGEYSSESKIFVIGWRDDIDTLTDVVEYKGVFYDIKRVDTFEGYKGNITITADKMVDQPKFEEIMPY